ncbi:MAG: hypothetical protein II800_05925 [Lachnospiraceae bacterium]|nr:hypothetical protein [Lachnospiraceae bacterium]
MRDQEKLAEYKLQMADYADRLEKEIDTFTEKHGDIGKTLATITKARSSGILRNALKGWSSVKIKKKFTLYKMLEEFPDFTQLDMKYVENIRNSKAGGYPVYEAVAAGYEAFQTMVDYTDAGEKGNLTSQKEKEFRNALHRQLKAAKQGLDIVKDTTPGTTAFEEKEKLLGNGISDFSYGRSGGVRNLFADVEARLTGVENGWPIEDLSVLARFNSVRHGLYQKAYYQADGTKREEPLFRPAEEADTRRAYLKQMDDMFEKLNTTPVNDADIRAQLLGEMSEIIENGMKQNILQGESFNKLVKNIKFQKKAKLFPAATENLGSHAEHVDGNEKGDIADDQAVAPKEIEKPENDPQANEQAVSSEEAPKEGEKESKENADGKTRWDDSYLYSSVNEVREQFERLFPGQSIETRYQDAQQAYDQVFPQGKDKEMHPVFNAMIGEMQKSKSVMYRIKDEAAFKTYRAQVEALSDRLDQDIEAFTKDKGEAGKTLAAIARARSSMILKNGLNGFAPARMRSEITLFRCLEGFADGTGLTDETLSDIQNTKLPIYRILTSGYEAVQTSVEYLSAREKGTLTAESENELRAKLYRQLSDTKAELEVIKNAAPETQYAYGRPGGISQTYADVEAQLIGLENGWPIEDLAALARFNSVRHSLNSRAWYDEKGIRRSTPAFRSKRESVYAQRMDELFEKLRTNQVLDYNRRGELLQEMTDVMKQGVDQKILTEESDRNAVALVSTQAHVNLSPVVMEKLGINAKGQFIFEQNENANLAFSMKTIIAGNFYSSMNLYLPVKDRAFFASQYELVDDGLDLYHPDYEKFDGYGRRAPLDSVTGPVMEMRIGGLYGKIEKDGQQIDALEQMRKITDYIRDAYQRKADEISAMEVNQNTPKYEKFREFYELNAKLCDRNGIYLGTTMRAPYMISLMSRTTSVPFIEKMGMDEIIRGLDQDPKNPLFDAYMDITTSGLREAVLEYRRQKMERRGFTKEDEKTYLQELKKEHEKTIAAYEKIWNTEDHRQYDKYINNPLRTVCGKTGGTERDISAAVGMLRWEVRGIENGWGAKDVHVFGFIGGIEQQIARYKEQLKSELEQSLERSKDRITKEALKEPDQRKREEFIQKQMEDLQKKKVEEYGQKRAELTAFESKFKEFRDKAWDANVTNYQEKAGIIRAFDAFVKENQQSPVLSDLMSPLRYGNLFASMRKDLNLAAARERIYPLLKKLATDKDYEKLTQMLTQIEAGERNPDQPEEDRDVMNEFLTEIATPGADGLFPQEKLEVLEAIADRMGRDLAGSMLQKADELEQMEEKVLSGKMPGTETFLDYEKGGAGDDREMIRDVVNNYIDLTSAAAKKEHAIRSVMERINTYLQPAKKSRKPVYKIDGRNVNLIDHMDKTMRAAMDYQSYHGQGGQLDEQTFKKKIERASEKPADIGQKGFEINPNAKEGESIFRKVPKDVENVQQASSKEEIGINYDATLNDRTWIAAYQSAVIQAATEAQAQLDRLEKMTRSSNSDEYIAMHDKLKAVAVLKDPGALDKLSPAQVEKAFDELRGAGATYESTHKGMFKGNIGTGRQRFNFSQDIQNFAQSAVDKIRQNNKGIDPERPLGEQEKERTDALNRARNAKSAAEQDPTLPKVKVVEYGSLESRLSGGGAQPRIDYAALREQLHKMQQQKMQQGPEKAGPGKNSFSMGK